MRATSPKISSRNIFNAFSQLNYFLELYNSVWECVVFDKSMIADVYYSNSYVMEGRLFSVWIRVATLPGTKKAKFGHKQFQKILKNDKRPNKGQISLKKFIKTTKLIFTIS